MLIFQHSRTNRTNGAQSLSHTLQNAIPEALRRSSRPLLPQVSGLDAVRHYTQLSQKTCVAGSTLSRFG